MIKKHRVIILNQAKEDTAEIRECYNLQQRGLGKRFSSDLRNTLQSISNNPTAFAVRYEQYRKANLSVFPCGVFFFINDSSKSVFVTAVLHDAMDRKL